MKIEIYLKIPDIRHNWIRFDNFVVRKILHGDRSGQGFNQTFANGSMVKYFGSVHSDQLQRFDQLVVNGDVGVDGLLRHGLAVRRNEIPKKII